jgi:predicted permease
MKPPESARRLLSRVFPADVREAVIGDLDEEFHRDIAPARGLRAARRWYWRQALGSVAAALRLRMRERQRTPQPGVSQEGMVSQGWRDIRYALRTWRREPVFALTAMATQALGIAVTTAVAAVAYGVLLRPLPYAEPSRLVQVMEGDRSGNFSYADFVELRAATRAFSHVAGFTGGSRSLMSPSAQAERLPSVEVTDGFFETLGVAPASGRSFSRADMLRQSPAVVILTHRAWVHRFGSNPALLGSTIMLNGTPHGVIGILPPEFEFPLRGTADLWLPLRPSPQQEARGYWHWMDVIARRRADVSDGQVASDLQLVAAARAAADPKWHADARLRAESLTDRIVGAIRPALLILLGAVTLVLLTACANLAGLLLARSGARVREMSVRAAVGAGTGRLVRQLVTESVMLSAAGGLAGLAAAHVLVTAALAAIPPRHRASLPYAEDIGLAPEVIVFSLGLSILTGLIFSVLPALRASRADLTAALRASRTSAPRPERRTHGLLVASEIALALVLLAGTGLLARSVQQLMHVSPGFDPRGLLTMRVALPGARYADAVAVRSLSERLLERLDAVPGVDGVALIDQLPLTGRSNTGVLQHEPPRAVEATVLVRTVSPNYFEVMGIPLLEGRAFTARDRDGAPPVVLVNRSLAAQIFGGASPLGERIWFEFFPGRPRWEISGVVDDEQFDEIDGAPAPVVYFSQPQSPSSGFSLVIRAAQPLAIVDSIRRAAAAIDPELPLYSVITMEEILESSRAMFYRKGMLSLLGVFAISALVLAVVAVYSLLAQAVSTRTREIGIRVALGARRRDVVRMMMVQGMAPAAVGIAAGVAASLAATRALRSMLFGVTPTDFVTLSTAVTVLAAVAAAACLVPTWRAARIDPAVTLRQD